MIYRKKIILALLQEFQDQIDKVKFQKLLFLFTSKQTEKSFHFIPFRLGCYSFQANSDLETLMNTNVISESENCWVKIDDKDYIKELTNADSTALKDFKVQFGAYSQEELVKYTYVNFPFYAIRSIIASDFLNTEEINKIEKQKRFKSESVLFTIGYEGLSIEEYLNKLIINDVRLLIDVRKNALSRKFGFSKKNLLNICNEIGIGYYHMPELGIESESRQNLNCQADYDILFDKYNQSTILANKESLVKIKEVIDTEKRVALTCFEKNSLQCHRTHIARAIMELPDINCNFKAL